MVAQCPPRAQKNTLHGCPSCTLASPRVPCNPPHSRNRHTHVARATPTAPRVLRWPSSQKFACARLFATCNVYTSLLPHATRLRIVHSRQPSLRSHTGGARTAPAWLCQPIPPISDPRPCGAFTNATSLALSTLEGPPSPHLLPWRIRRCGVEAGSSMAVQLIVVLLIHSGWRFWPTSWHGHGRCWLHGPTARLVNVLVVDHLTLASLVLRLANACIQEGGGEGGGSEARRPCSLPPSDWPLLPSHPPRISRMRLRSTCHPAHAYPRERARLTARARPPYPHTHLRCERRDELPHLRQAVDDQGALGWHVVRRASRRVALRRQQRELVGQREQLRERWPELHRGLKEGAPPEDVQTEARPRHRHHEPPHVL